jgi:hypothetical protein
MPCARAYANQGVVISTYCKDFNPDAWESVPVGDGEGMASSEDETLSGVGGVPTAVPVVDIDLPRVDEDRYAPISISLPLT